MSRNLTNLCTSLINKTKALNLLYSDLSSVENNKVIFSSQQTIEGLQRIVEYKDKLQAIQKKITEAEEQILAHKRDISVLLEEVGVNKTGKFYINHSDGKAYEIIYNDGDVSIGN